MLIRLSRSYFFVNVRVALAVWLRLPLAPVMVRVKLPGIAFLDVITVKVEVELAGLGVKLILEPAGWPARLKVTEPLKPFSAVIVTV